MLRCSTAGAEATATGMPADSSEASAAQHLSPSSAPKVSDTAPAGTAPAQVEALRANSQPAGPVLPPVKEGVVGHARAPPFHVYLYDGGHDRQEQRRALTHYAAAMQDPFVYVVDDWNW